MYSNALDLKDFYASKQGRVAQRILRQHLKDFWPSTKGLRILGVGFATPFLRPFMVDAERVAALMPAQQGAVFWPQDTAQDSRNLVALYEDGQWPIETSSVDRVLVVHGMEGMEPMLREAWRVLGGQGRLLMVVPNRSGVWARFDHTPFGHGTPYSLGQMRQILRDHMFVPERAERALFVPPVASRLMLSASALWENAGRRFFNAFGGVNIVEATKQVYAGHLAAAAATSATGARRRIIIAPNSMTRHPSKGEK